MIFWRKISLRKRFFNGGAYFFRLLGAVIDVQLVLTAGDEFIGLVAAVPRHIDNIQSRAAHSGEGKLRGFAYI